MIINIFFFLQFNTISTTIPITFSDHLISIEINKIFLHSWFVGWWRWWSNMMYNWMVFQFYYVIMRNKNLFHFIINFKWKCGVYLWTIQSCVLLLFTNNIGECIDMLQFNDEYKDINFWSFWDRHMVSVINDDVIVNVTFVGIFSIFSRLKTT